MLSTLTIVSLIANVILVVVTGVYTFLTYRLVSANNRLIEFSEQQIELQQRPYIEVSVVVRDGAPLFQLKVTNTGASSARNLKIDISPDFYRFHEKLEKNLIQGFPLFSQVTPSFPPKMEILYDLGVAYKFFEEDVDETIAPPEMVVKMSYGSGLKSYEDEIRLDIRMFGGAFAGSVGSLNELKKVNSNLEALVSGLSGISLPSRSS